MPILPWLVVAVFYWAFVVFVAGAITSFEFLWEVVRPRIDEDLASAFPRFQAGVSESDLT